MGSGTRALSLALLELNGIKPGETTTFLDFDADEAAKARRIRQFSDEFFSLARAQSAELNQYLTFSEPVTIKLAGIVYQIDPAGAGRPVSWAPTRAHRCGGSRSSTSASIDDPR